MGTVKISGKMLCRGIDIEIIDEKIDDTSRWSIWQIYIIKYKGKFYEVGRSIGATEMQDEDSWCDAAMYKEGMPQSYVEGIEVEQREVCEKKWVPKE
jgi:hypothetical protein